MAGITLSITTRAVPVLVTTILLTACSKQATLAVCDEAAQRRARQFMTQVLEQEANGLRLRELAAKGGRKVFYANVGYEPAEERSWEQISIRKEFTVASASCSSQVTGDNGSVAAQLIDVRVVFPAGIWFDRENYGELPAGENVYTLRLEDRFKITSRLPQPFVSGKAAMSVLGTEPYTADRLLALREDLADGQQQ